MESRRFSANVLSPITIVFIGALLVANGLLSLQMVSHTSRPMLRVPDRLSERSAINGLDVTRYRISICYIYTRYSLKFRDGHVRFRGSAGTGFVVRDGVIATGRHVIEPWYRDDEEQALLRSGVQFRITRIDAFFPGRTEPFVLTQPINSDTQDVALIHFGAGSAAIPPMPLASVRPNIGEAVIVVGYPASVTAMLAKSSETVRNEVLPNNDTLAVARQLAVKSLISPLATFGHLGDITEDVLVYDAATAPGVSGGPVLNSRGEVIAIDVALIEGFSGGNLGIPIESIWPLLKKSPVPGPVH